MHSKISIHNEAMSQKIESSTVWQRAHDDLIKTTINHFSSRNDASLSDKEAKFINLLDTNYFSLLSHDEMFKLINEVQRGKEIGITESDKGEVAKVYEEIPSVLHHLIMHEADNVLIYLLHKKLLDSEAASITTLLFERKHNLTAPNYTQKKIAKDYLVRGVKHYSDLTISLYLTNIKLTNDELKAALTANSDGLFKKMVLSFLPDEERSYETFNVITLSKALNDISTQDQHVLLLARQFDNILDKGLKGSADERNHFNETLIFLLNLLKENLASKNSTKSQQILYNNFIEIITNELDKRYISVVKDKTATALNELLKEQLLSKDKEPDPILVLYLILMGVDVNIVADKQPLLIQALKRSSQTVKLFSINSRIIEALSLSPTFNINLAGKGILNALYYAIEHCQTIFALKLVTMGIWNNDLKVGEEKVGSCIQDAARYNDLIVIKALLSIGADVNERSSWGQYALLEAIEKHNSKIYNYLLTLDDIDVTLEDCHKKTALSYALSHNDAELVWKLIDKEIEAEVIKSGNRLTPLHIIARIKPSEYNWDDFYDGEYDSITHELISSPDVDINAQDINGMTPLMFAIQSGHYGIFEDLIDNLYGKFSFEFNFNIQDNNGKTALHYAAEYKSMNYTNLLIHKFITKDSVDLNIQDKDGKTALHYAVEKDNADVVKSLVSSRIDINTRDKDGQTPLHYAARHEKLQYVEIFRNRQLCKTYADLDIKDNDGKTPIYYAVEKDNVDIVRSFIISKLINLNTKDNRSFNVLSYAMPKSKCEKLLEARGVNRILPNGEEVIPVLQAIKNNDCEECVKIIKTENFKPNFKDENGKTVLHWAIEKNFLEIITLLVNNPKTKLEIEDEEGLTPLDYAIKSNNTKLALSFINQRSRPIARRYIQVANNLHEAAKMGNIEVVKALLLRKDLVHLTKDSSESYNSSCNDYMPYIIAIAIANNHSDTAILLLEKGVMYPQSFIKNAPKLLHSAARKGQVDTIEVLLKLGYDINYLDENGQTPLMLAVQSQSLEAIKEMIESPKVDINRRDKYNRSALDYTASNLQIKIFLEAKGAEVRIDEFIGPIIFQHILTGKTDLCLELVNNKNFNHNSLYKNQTPLIAAICVRQYAIAEAFIKNSNIDLNTSDYEGNTALHHAAANNQYTLMKLLLRNGADPYACNKKHEAFYDCINFSEKCILGATLLTHSFLLPTTILTTAIIFSSPLTKSLPLSLKLYASACLPVIETCLVINYKLLKNLYFNSNKAQNGIAIIIERQEPQLNQ